MIMKSSGKSLFKDKIYQMKNIKLLIICLLAASCQLSSVEDQSLVDYINPNLDKSEPKRRIL